MKVIIFALLVAFAASSIVMDPYQQMATIKNCIPTVNNASEQCNTIDPKQNNYFERYLYCYQVALSALPKNCSELFCQSEMLGNVGVDCTKSYYFNDTIYNYNPAKDPLSADCKKALTPAVNTCNDKFSDFNQSDYYSKFFDCVVTQPQVMNVTGCAAAYCKESGLGKYVNCQDPALMNFQSIIVWPHFNFTDKNGIPIECEKVLNATSYICNKIPSNTVNYYEYYYQCYQQQIQYAPCYQAWCKVFKLDTMGVDCSKTYSLPAPTVIPQPKPQPTCFTQNIEGCYDVISPAVEVCFNKSKNATGDQYYNEFYACLQAQPKVKAIDGCAQCYCQQIRLFDIVKGICPAPEQKIEKMSMEFHQQIIPDCIDKINATSYICDKIDSRTENYFEYYYQCFQQNIKNFECSKAFCFEYQLNYVGVDCNKTYNLPKPQPPKPLPKPLPTCITQNIPGCFDAIESAVQVCNKTVKSANGSYYTEFYNCVKSQPNVSKIDNCAVCYCQQVRLFDLVPGTCPAPANNTKMTTYMMNYIQKEKQVFNFTKQINPNCQVLINKTSYYCDKLNPQTPDYYKYYYQCFQQKINNQDCSKAFCKEYKLNFVGVDCNTTYNLPKPVIPKPVVPKKPRCQVNNIPKCFDAISSAVQSCNKTVTNQTNYYTNFYSCVKQDKTVSSLNNCASCYCEEVQLDKLMRASC